MSETVLYTDLSAYYDLMCADINYQAQSDSIARLNRMFGNGGIQHLDLACGTGPHIRHFLDKGYQSQGLDLNQPMLDKAKVRCPEADFSLQNMCSFEVDQPVDLITCFLYSLHYCGDLEPLSLCIEAVNNAFFVLTLSISALLTINRLRHILYIQKIVALTSARDGFIRGTAHNNGCV